MPSPLYTDGSFDASGQLPTNADDARAARVFVGLWNSIVGSDQTYAGQDGNPTNASGQFVIALPDGSQAILGQPVSNRQTAPVTTTSSGGLVLSPMLLLIIAGVAFLAMK
ncbi:MAG: hypothetical protein JWQ72_2648 [Polaromonas sp.]|nr:hypothetical protein [Polaromonas sp.]